MNLRSQYYGHDHRAFTAIIMGMTIVSLSSHYTGNDHTVLCSHYCGSHCHYYGH